MIDYLQTKILSFFLCLVERFERWMLYNPPKKVNFITDRKISFETSQGKQIAHYDIYGTPNDIWLCFGGASTDASIWREPVSRLQLVDNTMFIYVDFPGYGLCEGTATPVNVQETCDKIIEYLQQRVNLDNVTINALGWSLGAAAATQFALIYRKFNGLLVLIAPFTSINDIAEYRYGSFVSKFVTHCWNVETMLRMLYRFRSLRIIKRIVVFYGGNDEVVPKWMRERIKLSNPTISMYVNDNCDHNSIIEETIPFLSAEILANKKHI